MTDRLRRLYTFTVPLLLKLTSTRESDGITRQIVRPKRVLAGEGTADELTDEGSLFLTLDLVYLDNLAAVQPDVPVSVWVSRRALAAEQVHVPVEDPGSILDIAQPK